MECSARDLNHVRRLHAQAANMLEACNKSRATQTTQDSQVTNTQRLNLRHITTLDSHNREAIISETSMIQNIFNVIQETN